MAHTDRSQDVSQPVERLGPDESLKAASDYLRGTINEGLLDRITGAIPASGDVKLMKFHGIYQQDDRDIRDERRRQRLEPAYQFMVRVRLPGGVCTAAQWCALDQLARAHGGNTLRLTTRQTFQFHWVLKHDLKALIGGLHAALLDTIAACGDDSRGVMCTADASASDLHAEVAALATRVSNHVIPRTRGYHEIWYGEERVATSENEEPFYGRTYLPRKFKIGFVIPPSNDIDVYSQDLGYIAISQSGRLEGFNVAIGGGMGRTDQARTTYPRLANVIGFIATDELLPVSEAIMSVQRDYGNRLDRQRARFKYTIDDKGLDWIVNEVEQRQGFRFAPARSFEFASNGDTFGWVQDASGLWRHTLRVESGRIAGQLMDVLLELAKSHRGDFRLTPNQNLTIAGVRERDRSAIEALLQQLPPAVGSSALRRNSIACVALPTCGLAMAEAERYLPDLTAKIELLLDRHGLRDAPITLRVSGCPNGCSRPYVGEIALTGRAPGKYNLYLGGGFQGQRLNKMFRENIGETIILETLDEVLGRYAHERTINEHFGDFVIRAGIVAEVAEGRFFND